MPILEVGSEQPNSRSLYILENEVRIEMEAFCQDSSAISLSIKFEVLAGSFFPLRLHCRS